MQLQVRKKIEMRAQSIRNNSNENLKEEKKIEQCFLTK